MHLFKPTYTGKDGKPRESLTWYVEYSEPGGRRARRSLETHDRAVALVKMGELQRALELKAAGIETYHESRDLSLADLILDYGKEMARRGRSERHRKLTVAAIQRHLEGARTLSDATPERIRASLSALAERGRTPRTLNRDRCMLNAFFRWVVAEQKWGCNPVAAVMKAKERGPALRRRALEREELGRLMTVAPRRALIYHFGALTGLRRGEMKKLACGDLDLGGGTVRVRAAISKNGKESFVPLAPDLVDALKAAVGDRPPAALVFPQGMPRVQTFYKDLTRAGIARETPDGRLDFHALRVTTARLLERSGASLVQAQRILRHCDPKLTANVYTRLTVLDGKQAVARIALTGPAVTPTTATASTAARQSPATPDPFQAAQALLEQARHAPDPAPFIAAAKALIDTTGGAPRLHRETA